VITVDIQDCMVHSNIGMVCFGAV